MRVDETTFNEDTCACEGKLFGKGRRQRCRQRVIIHIKAELPQEGILFHTQFPSLGIFINKKVGFLKN